MNDVERPAPSARSSARTPLESTSRGAPRIVAQPPAGRQPAPQRWQLLLAFALVYFVWGSTYLAIRFAVETLPPFLMAGTRFLVAGGLLYAWARLYGRAEAPTRAQWRAAAITGVLLFVFGNGAVVWVELTTPSGLVALIVGVEPCFMVLIDWLRTGTRPGAQVATGLFLGLGGLALLIGPDSLMGGGRADVVAVAVLVVGCFGWAAGSVYSRDAALPRSAFLTTAMQMLAGGLAMTLVALVHGELGPLHGAFTAPSLAGWLYLVVFGSIVAFTAYAWLLRVQPTARVSTFAYVNPVVAVLLGWAIADEPLTGRMIAAAAVIVGGVALITLAPQQRPAH